MRDAGGHLAIRRQQDHLRIRAVLRLGKQVRGDEIRGGAAVGDHQHFRRPGGHIDSRAVKTLADLALGFGHEGVARAKDFIDLRHRFGAERQGGNRLRAADVKDIAHAAQLGGIEDFIGNRRRRTQHHLLAARDARRRGEHQHRGEQRRRAAGNI